MKNTKHVYIKGALVAFLGSAIVGCTGTSTTGGSGLIISGSLSSSSLMSYNKARNNSKSANAYAVQFQDLEVVATVSTEPPKTVRSEVNADGSFSIDVGSDAKGKPMEVAFVNEETDSVIAEMKFTDDNDKDLNGNARSEAAVIANSSLTLGTLTLSNEGTVQVPKNAIADKIEDTTAVAAATAFDPTGEWTMSAYDGTLGSNFQTVGACGSDGPCVGFPVTLVRLSGKEFSPSTGQCAPNASGTLTGGCPVTSGTVGTKDRFALSIWGGDFNDSVGACGSRTGFTLDEARAFGRIHVTVSPTVGVSSVAFGSYVYSTPAGFGGTGVAPYNQPWMYTGATANHSQPDCRPFSVSGTTVLHKAWACKADVMTGSWPGSVVSAGTTVGWNIGIQGSGCINSDTSKPVNVSNWSQMGYGTCNSQSASATYGVGFTSNTCTFANADHDGVSTTATVNVQCTHIGGQFEDSAGNPSSTPLTLPMGQYLGQPKEFLAHNAACDSAGSGSDAAIIAGYRCFAESYWQNQPSGSGCYREYNFDWQATSPGNFVRGDFKGKPRNAFITNILNYSADGKSAFLENEESDSITIPTGANSSTFCKVNRRIQMNFKSISATKMLVELKESGRMASTDAACVAAGNYAMANLNTSNPQDNGEMQHLKESLRGMKMIFYLNK